MSWVSESLVFDMEADGLLDTITKIHCIVCHDRATGRVTKYYDKDIGVPSSGTIADGLQLMYNAGELIAHNEVGYDLPALFKIVGWQPNPATKVTDTLVMSKTLNPDRAPVRGCRSGPHSIEAWGIRLGIAKPVHEEWEVFTPEMLHRCVEDVKINVQVYEHLKEEEGGLDYTLPYSIETRAAQECFTAEQHGWPFDEDKANENLGVLAQGMSDIEAVVVPMIPLIPASAEGNIKGSTLHNKCNRAMLDGALSHHFSEDQQGKSWVSSPFLLNGEESSQVKKHFPEGESRFVWGPFSRVSWSIINLKSDKQVKRYLLSIGWRPLEWNISKKTGQVTSPKLTDESLESLADPSGKMIAKWLKMSHRHSMITGWIKAIRPDGRVPSIMNALGCPTLRMTHRVLVNVPSVEKKAFFAEESRSCFIADPGYVIVGADAASCQLRLLTHYMGDADYRDAVLHGDKELGADIHSVNMRAAGLDNRGRAKNFIYGFLFGAGADKVGRLIDGDAKAGQAIINRFLKQLPALGALRKDLERVWKANGHLTALDGRRIYVRKKHELLCYLLQGAEALVMKLAIAYTTTWIRQEQLDAALINVMHDEYSFHTLRQHSERVAFLLEEGIRQAGVFFGLETPMAGGAAIGNNWAEVH